jgi:tetratricopeptide (TPR) repeat protein
MIIKSENKFQLPAGVVFIVLACIAAYMPAIRGGFIWDDETYVVENKLLTEPDGLYRIWFTADSPSQYFPLVYTTFRFEHKLWGLNPLGFHIVNLLLHIANSLLLWLLLFRLGIPAAWLAASIFALHPVQVESAAWITERKNVLMTFFLFLSLLMWFRFIEGPRQSGRRWGVYVLSLLLYSFALFSKTTACTLPAALVLILWFKRIRLDKKRWLEIVPYVLLGLAMSSITMWWEYIRYIGGTTLKLNWLERALLASRALWFYLGKLIWPTNLTFSYPKWNITAADPYQYIWLLAWLVAALCMWRWRERIGRGFIAAIVFFAVTLLPMLGFFSLYTFRYTYVADHYQYVACIGPILLVTTAGCRLAARLDERKRQIAVVLPAFVLIVLGVLTWQQCHAYKDLETLYGDIIRKNPGSWMAHYNLGVTLKGQDKLDEAISYYQQTLRIKPDFMEAYDNLAVALAQQNRFNEAIDCCQQGLRIKPDSAGIHCNLGIILGKYGRLDDAADHFRQALRLKPDYADACYNLGNLLQVQGKLDDAVSYYKQAINLNPDFAKAYDNIGAVLLAQGKLDEAISYYLQALDIEPNDVMAHYNLGFALLQQGRFDEAAGHLRQALRIKPDFVEAKHNLEIALKSGLQGRPDKPIGHFSENPKIDVNNAEAGKAIPVSPEHKK